MRKTPLAICVGMSILASAGCSSTPPVQRVTPPAPPAWMMQPPPNSLQTLDKIIFVSESN